MSEKREELRARLEGIRILIRLEVGRRIREAREQQSMSQAHLAEILARRQAYISELETGKTEPNATMLAQLALVLQKPVAFFFPPQARDFSPPAPLKPDELSLEERELITRLREVAYCFSHQQAMHLVNALADYSERQFEAFQSDIPTEEELMARQYEEDMKYFEELDRRDLEE